MAKGVFFNPSCLRGSEQGRGPQGLGQSGEVQSPLSPLKARVFICRCEGSFPFPVPGRCHPGRGAAGVPRPLEGMRASPRPSP